MRPPLTVFAVLVLATGCTHTALERRTVKQASTLTDLQYQQVLDNLAMFACNPDTMPWHVRLKGGLVQVADQGSGAFGADIATALGGEVTRLLPSAGAQRGIVSQWDVEPAVDDDDLDLLRLAYAKSVVRDPEKIKEIDKDIRLQIWKLVLTYEFAPGATTLLAIMADGLDDGFELLTKQLDKVSLIEPSAAANIATAKGFIEAAKKNLEEAVDRQRFESKKTERSENDPVLKGHLVQFKTNLLQASAALKPLLEAARGKESKEALQQIKGRIDYMADLDDRDHRAEENLRLIVAHLNPVISRALDQGRKEGKERFQEPFGAQFYFLAYVGARKYLIPQGKGKVQDRNPGLADQAKNKVATLKQLAYAEQTPWFYYGTKKDVPKCACYVGHYKGCGRDCYVWVMPDQMEKLREFTLTVLSLAPSERQDLTVLGRGAAFSPGGR